MMILGLTGTAGSGKDTIADMLCEMYGFENLSTSNLVRAITRYIYRQPHDFNPVRDQLFAVANELRALNPTTTVELCLLQAKELNIELALITGLRSMGEADAVRAAGGKIIGIDADIHVRYERMYKRARDEEAKKTFEQFAKHDAYENEGLASEGDGRGIRYIIESSDIHIANSGSMDELKKELEAKIGPLVKGKK